MGRTNPTRACEALHSDRIGDADVDQYETHMTTLDRYFDALRSHDWESLAACLAPDVHRNGPYLDEFRGRADYVAFLSRVLPSLVNYELEITRIRELPPHSAVVELSETVDLDGARKRTPEVLLFDFDDEDRIMRVDIYIKQT